MHCAVDHNITATAGARLDGVRFAVFVEDDAVSSAGALCSLGCWGRRYWGRAVRCRFGGWGRCLACVRKTIGEKGLDIAPVNVELAVENVIQLFVGGNESVGGQLAMTRWVHIHGEVLELELTIARHALECVVVILEVSRAMKLDQVGMGFRITDGIMVSVAELHSVESVIVVAVIEVNPVVACRFEVVGTGALNMHYAAGARDLHPVFRVEDDEREYGVLINSLGGGFDIANQVPDGGA